MLTKSELLSLLAENNRRLVDLLWNSKTKAAPDPAPEPMPKPKPPPPNETWYQMQLRKALEAEARGECVVMRDPHIKPKPPRKPSWDLT